MKAIKCLPIAGMVLLLSVVDSDPTVLSQVEDPVSDSSSSAKNAITETIRDYIKGWYEGDVDRMDRTLHAALVKRIPVSNGDGDSQKLRAVTKERMVELTRAGGGGTPEASYEIEVHHVYGNIATGLVRSEEYLDYVHLVETADGWKIANILFQTHD